MRPPKSTVSAAEAAASSATTSGRPLVHADVGGRPPGDGWRSRKDGLRDAAAAGVAVGEEDAGIDAAAAAVAAAATPLDAAMAAHERGAAVTCLGVLGAAAATGGAGIGTLIDGDSATPAGGAAPAGVDGAAGTGVEGGLWEEVALLVLLAYAAPLGVARSMGATGCTPLGTAPLRVAARQGDDGGG